MISLQATPFCLKSSVADLLMEVRRRWQPGKPAEIAFGKRFLELARPKLSHSALAPQEVLEMLSSDLTFAGVGSTVAEEMTDWLSTIACQKESA